MSLTPSAADTIYALASAPGRAGVAVVRVSGPRAHAIATQLARRPLPSARRAQLVALADDSGVPLDKALLLRFDAPHSFTGEDVVELHLHGGKAVINGVLAALSAAGGRLAEPGEFTRRAFTGGRLDLAEAEGLADLINAETEAQRRQALRQMDGELSALYEGWRARLMQALAHIEADIDFPDEELPPELVAARMAQLETLAAELDAHLNDARRGERLREGFAIAIVGAPNAGKSSLLNALALREAAIVSARAGTTRDVVEVHLDLAGYPVILADTAGLRESSDEIESEGIRRARARAESADLKLIVFDAAVPPDEPSLRLTDETSFVIINKMDAAPALSPAHRALGPGAAPRVFALSARSGEGLPALLEALAARLKALSESSAAPPLTRARHREAITRARTHIGDALSGYAARRPAELVAEELRLAARSLGRITGRVDVEDLLDIIFRDFCIGK